MSKHYLDKAKRVLTSSQTANKIKKLTVILAAMKYSTYDKILFAALGLLALYILFGHTVQHLLNGNHEGDHHHEETAY